MVDKRMTSERRAKIEALAQREEDIVFGRWNADDKVRLHMGVTDLLSELTAVEKENRTLREGLEEAMGYLAQLRETSDASNRMECASRAHAALDGALTRAGGGTDA